MMVKDWFAETRNPNQNMTELMGVRFIKQGTEIVMNYSGAPNNMWSYAHLYMASVNSICASPFLGWKTPISHCHWYTPDISVYLLYMFCEPIYFKEDKHWPKPGERKRNWIGVFNNVEFLFTYLIYSQDTGIIVSRSDIRTADSHRRGVINKKLDRCIESEDTSKSDSRKILPIDKTKLRKYPRLHNSDNSGKKWLKYNLEQNRLEILQDYILQGRKTMFYSYKSCNQPEDHQYYKI